MDAGSFLPTRQELIALIDYLITNPDLFIHSTTVITSVIVAAAIGLRTVLVFAHVIGAVVERLLHAVAPAVALILLYFGIGAMALSTEILVRFHAAIPATTEEQFRSGAGHLLIAMIGVLALLPWLTRRSAREWLAANLVAVGYWAYQVIVLTPPWFSFQGQRALVLAVVAVLLGASATATVLALVRVVRASQRAAEVFSERPEASVVRKRKALSPRSIVTRRRPERSSPSRWRESRR